MGVSSLISPHGSVEEGEKNPCVQRCAANITAVSSPFPRGKGFRSKGIAAMIEVVAPAAAAPS